MGIPFQAAHLNAECQLLRYSKHRGQSQSIQPTPFEPPQRAFYEGDVSTYGVGAALTPGLSYDKPGEYFTALPFATLPTLYVAALRFRVTSFELLQPSHPTQTHHTQCHRVCTLIIQIKFDWEALLTDAFSDLIQDGLRGLRLPS